MKVSDQDENYSITIIREMMKTKRNQGQFYETEIQDQTQEVETHQ